MSNKFKALIITFSGVITALLVALCVLTVSSQVKLNTVVEQYDEYLNGSVHDIYDDTAVVEAYKSGDSSKLDEEQKYILDTASGILKDVVKDGMADYEKEKAVYDWQYKYINLDESNFAAIPDDSDNSTPYGVLRSHSAICVGNATTFKLFMDMLGIDCKIIHSTSSGEHAWNMVELDGEWYHTDITFDGGLDVPSYSVFNVPDTAVADNGFPYNSAEYPQADSVKYCYVYQNAIQIDSVYDLPKVIKKAIDEENGTLYIRYGDTVTQDTDRGNVSSAMSDAVDFISSSYLPESTYLSITEKRFGDSFVGIISISDSTSDESFDSERLAQEASKYFFSDYEAMG